MGLNVGSTPLEIYKYYFVRQQDQISINKIHLIQAIYSLLQLCHAHHIKFPLKMLDREVDF